MSIIFILDNSNQRIADFCTSASEKHSGEPIYIQILRARIAIEVYTLSTAKSQSLRVYNLSLDDQEEPSWSSRG
jgi:hypothetical protein